jgi:hypothetical protein
MTLEERMRLLGQALADKMGAGTMNTPRMHVGTAPVGTRDQLADYSRQNISTPPPIPVQQPVAPMPQTQPSFSDQLDQYALPQKPAPRQFNRLQQKLDEPVLQMREVTNENQDLSGDNDEDEKKRRGQLEKSGTAEGSY